MAQREQSPGTDGREARPSFAVSPLGPEGLDWYALHVRSNFEFRVRERCPLLGIEVFLPTFSEISRWTDRTKTIERAIFPGYVFVFCRRDDLAILVQLAGVAYVVTSDGIQPAVIPAREIGDLRRAIADPSIEPCPYVAGQAIEIESGPLAGVTGVVRRTRGALRVVVAITFLRRAISVEVDAADLRRA